MKALIKVLFIALSIFFIFVSKSTVNPADKSKASFADKSKASPKKTTALEGSKGFDYNKVLFVGEFTLGGLIRGKADVGSEIYVNNKKILVTDDGYFVFGIPINESLNKYSVKSVKTLNSFSYEQVFHFNIKKRAFNVQKITGISILMSSFFYRF